MGSVGDKKWCGCACNLWSSSSSSSASVKLLLCMVSLIVLCGFVFVWGPLESNWVFLSSSSSSSTGAGAGAVTSMKNIHVNDKKEAISDDYLLNRSSTPPQTIEAIHVQFVRTLSFFLFFFFFLIKINIQMI